MHFSNGYLKGNIQPFWSVFSLVMTICWIKRFYVIFSGGGVLPQLLLLLMIVLLLCHFYTLKSLEKTPCI